MEIKQAFEELCSLIRARDWINNAHKSRLILNKLEVLRNYPEMEHLDVNINKIIEKVGNQVFLTVEPYFDYNSAAYKLLHDQFYSNTTYTQLMDSL